MTSNMTMTSTYQYDDAPNQRTFVFTAFNGGPPGTKRLLFTETIVNNSYNFQYNTLHDRFESYGAGAAIHYWVPPVGFAWDGSYPVNTETDV